MTDDHDYIPDGALFVELLDLLVDEGLRVLPLVLRPARLQKHPVGCVGLLAPALRHLVTLFQSDFLIVYTAVVALG